MLRSETLFGKRETNTPNSPFGGANVTPPSAAAASRIAQPIGSTSTSSSAVSTAASNNNSSTNEIGSKLIVGPNIKLKGVEIDDCDTLVVEGRVEATMVSRAIQIAEHGAFNGKVDVDVAEIRGAFQGEMTARKKLVIHASGRVSGKIRYGKMLIQEGGELSGDIGALGDNPVQLAK